MAADFPHSGSLPPVLAEAARLLKTSPADAEARTRVFLAASPDHRAARLILIEALRALGRGTEAAGEIDGLIARDPRDRELYRLKAAVLLRSGDYAGVVACHDEMLKDRPDDAQLWLAQGHLLRSVGRREDAIAAYRKVIALRPGTGEAYWSLANLKTLPLSPDDAAAMEAQLARADLGEADRAPLHFARARAFEDSGAYDEAFAQYVKGNALARRLSPYDPEETTALVQRSKAVFTAEFFGARTGTGHKAADPIFIVGMPRSGSTLVDQILASHSAVEGTTELVLIGALAERLGGPARGAPNSAYPTVVAILAYEEFAALGLEYLARTRVHRRGGTPRFTDKMPNNFLHVGLIHLILPNARIVDVRRHPLACCVSNFRQFFPRGQGFANDLAACGRYYRDYVELMAHWDAVLPGKVHRVLYEDLVARPEDEIRKLLAHCSLPFEETCLRFYENDRTVLTPSSEQVRHPISREGLEHWRHFESWLDPLKAALGPVLDVYPGVPAF